MQLLALACCFGRTVGHTASKECNEGMKHGVKASARSCAAAKANGRGANFGIDAPWELHLGHPFPSPLTNSDSPVAIVAVDHLDGAHTLGLSFECVFINRAVQQILGLATPQAYQRLVLSALLDTEPNLAQELSETLHSLQEPVCHTPLVPVASVATTVSRGSDRPPSSAQPAAAPRPKVHRGAPAPVIWHSRFAHTHSPFRGSISRNRADTVSSAVPDSGNDDGVGGSSDNGDSEYCSDADAASVDFGLEGIRLHPCWVHDRILPQGGSRGDGSGGGGGSSGDDVGCRRRPGVVVWHRQRLKGYYCRALALRSLGIMSHLDAAVTLLSCSGRVVFQNTASRRYHGCLTALRGSKGDGDAAALAPAAPAMGTHASSCGGGGGGGIDRWPQLRHPTKHVQPCGALAVDRQSMLLGFRTSYVLARIFSCDLHHLADDLLAAWESGRSWKRLLHVPPAVTLNDNPYRLWLRQQMVQTVLQPQPQQPELAVAAMTLDSRQVCAQAPCGCDGSQGMALDADRLRLTESSAAATLAAPAMPGAGSRCLEIPPPPPPRPPPPSAQRQLLRITAADGIPHSASPLPHLQTLPPQPPPPLPPAPQPQQPQPSLPLTPTPPQQLQQPQQPQQPQQLQQLQQPQQPQHSSPMRAAPTGYGASLSTAFASGAISSNTGHSNFTLLVDGYPETPYLPLPVPSGKLRHSLAEPACSSSSVGITATAADGLLKPLPPPQGGGGGSGFIRAAAVATEAVAALPPGLAPRPSSRLLMAMMVNGKEPTAERSTSLDVVPPLQLPLCTRSRPPHMSANGFSCMAASSSGLFIPINAAAGALDSTDGAVVSGFAGISTSDGCNGCGRVVSAAGSSNFLLGGDGGRQVPTETHGSVIEDNPLQLSAWRAALKISTSRRITEGRCVRPPPPRGPPSSTLIPTTPRSAAAILASATGSNGLAATMSGSRPHWHVPPSTSPNRDLTVAASAEGASVAVSAADSAASGTDAGRAASAAAGDGAYGGSTGVSAVATSPNGAAAATLLPPALERTRSKRLCLRHTGRSISSRCLGQGCSPHESAIGRPGTAVGLDGRVLRGHDDSGARSGKRSSLELAMALAASAGGKSFSVGSMRGPPPLPPLMQVDGRAHISVRGRDSIDSLSSIARYLLPVRGSSGGGGGGSGTAARLAEMQQLTTAGTTAAAPASGTATATATDVAAPMAARSIQTALALASEVAPASTTFGGSAPNPMDDAAIDPWDAAEACSGYQNGQISLLEMQVVLASSLGSPAALAAAAAGSAPTAREADASARDKQTWGKTAGPLPPAVCNDTADGAASNGDDDAVADHNVPEGMPGGSGCDDDKASHRVEHIGPGGDGEYAEGGGRDVHVLVPVSRTEHRGAVDACTRKAEEVDPLRHSLDPWVARLLDVGGVPSALLPEASPRPPSALEISTTALHPALSSPPPPPPPPPQTLSPNASTSPRRKAVHAGEATGAAIVPAAMVVAPVSADVASPRPGQQLLSVPLPSGSGARAGPGCGSGHGSRQDCVRALSQPWGGALMGVPEAEENLAASTDGPLLCHARPPHRHSPVASVPPPPATSVAVPPVPPALLATNSSYLDERSLCWHEVTASPFHDPVTGQRMLLLVQADVTARVEAERKLVELTAAQTGMLEQMFPRHVLEFVAQQGEAIGGMDFSANVEAFATSHDLATVLFTDIVGFTTMSKMVPAATVMAFLSELYSKLDALVDEYGVWKVETAGDCYIVAAGVVRQDADGFQSVVASERRPYTLRPSHRTYPPATAVGNAIPNCNDLHPTQSLPPQQQQQQGYRTLQQNQRHHFSECHPQPQPQPQFQRQASSYLGSAVAAAAAGAATKASQDSQGHNSARPLFQKQPSDMLSLEIFTAEQLDQHSDYVPAGTAAGVGGGTSRASVAAAAAALDAQQPTEEIAAEVAEAQARRDADAVFQFALAMLEEARGVCMPHNHEPVQLRVGIHSGPLVSGVIGTKMPKFALFGDTMNTASRMESTCKPGCIQVSARTRALLPHVPLRPTGGVMVKGKGAMETYVFEPRFRKTTTAAPASATAIATSAAITTLTAPVAASAAAATAATTSIFSTALLTDNVMATRSTASTTGDTGDHIGLARDKMELSRTAVIEMSAAAAAAAATVDAAVIASVGDGNSPSASRRYPAITVLSTVPPA